MNSFVALFFIGIATVSAFTLPSSSSREIFSVRTNYFASMGCKRPSRGPLRYRTVDDDVVGQEFYTDKLWAAALRSNSNRDEGSPGNMSASVAADSTLLELRPISVSLKKTKGPNNDFIETAKAFTLVAIEVGVVAAAAANNMY